MKLQKNFVALVITGLSLYAIVRFTSSTWFTHADRTTAAVQNLIQDGVAAQKKGDFINSLTTRQISPNAPSQYLSSETQIALANAQQPDAPTIHVDSQNTELPTDNDHEVVQLHYEAHDDNERFWARLLNAPIPELRYLAAKYFVTRHSFTLQQLNVLLGRTGNEQRLGACELLRIAGKNEDALAKLIAYLSTPTDDWSESNFATKESVTWQSISLEVLYGMQQLPEFEKRLSRHKEAIEKSFDRVRNAKWELATHDSHKQSLLQMAVLLNAITREQQKSQQLPPDQCRREMMSRRIGIVVSFPSTINASHIDINQGTLEVTVHASGVSDGVV